MQLICVFIFAYAKSRLSCDTDDVIRVFHRELIQQSSCVWRVDNKINPTSKGQKNRFIRLKKAVCTCICRVLCMYDLVTKTFAEFPLMTQKRIPSAAIIPYFLQTFSSYFTVLARANSVALCQTAPLYLKKQSYQGLNWLLLISYASFQQANELKLCVVLVETQRHFIIFKKILCPYATVPNPSIPKY